MSAVVTTEGLTKAYGRRTVVAGLDLQVPEGSVYGFLGPNGSGKSTTMKMLLGLVTASSGTAVVLGQEVTRANLPRILPAVGSLIEAPPGYGHLTGAENMEVIRRMVGATRADIDRAVRTVRLEKRMKDLVRNYSFGMKQRLGIAMALARNPRLLILDEPTNGLDPSGIEEIRTLITSMPSQGVTVMVSSHLLSEIDKTADHLAIIDTGRLVFQGSRAELFQQSLPDVVIGCTGEDSDKVLARWEPRTTPEGYVLGSLNDTEVTDAVEALVHAGCRVHEVRRMPQSLEEVFIDLTGRGATL